MRRRLGNVGLALSGGYDSRCVGSILAKRGPDTKALTFGQPGSAELRLGTEVARILGISPRTADRTWAYARAWLHQAVAGDFGPGDENSGNPVA